MKKDLPLSLVLGAGGVRGFAHAGALEALVQAGFQISEIVGTSAGAIIGTLYAATGLRLDELVNFGLSMTSRNMLSWAVYRRLPTGAPAVLREHFHRRAGIIPHYVGHLNKTKGRELCHGVQRLGIVCYDLRRRREAFFVYPGDALPAGEAARGSAAIPGFFPSRRYVDEQQGMRLVDGGLVNGFPVDKLFAPPFAPRQILVIDVSNKVEARERNARKVAALRARHPEIPIEILTPDTLGIGTVLYRKRDLMKLIEAGRQSVAGIL
ncbi:MAG: patatin-like phospholipase family protein [Blastocatellia bacterium]